MARRCWTTRRELRAAGLENGPGFIVRDAGDVIPEMGTRMAGSEKPSGMKLSTGNAVTNVFVTDGSACRPRRPESVATYMALTARAADPP